MLIDWIPSKHHGHNFYVNEMVIEVIVLLQSHVFWSLMIRHSAKYCILFFRMRASVHIYYFFRYIIFWFISNHQRFNKWATRGVFLYLSLYHDFIPSNDTFVTMLSFLNVHRINPVKEYLHFVDAITLENRSVFGLHEGRWDWSC